jgi:lysophospholipase L1-like esterase
VNPNLRAILLSAAFLLFGCAGIIGVYLGVVSQADRLRPTVQTGAPGEPPYPSAIALDSARTRNTLATTPRAPSDQAAGPSDTTSAAAPPAAASDNGQAEPPSVVAALARGAQTPPKDQEGARRAITILQLGDSHTSADFLTGEIRRRLQETYGNGGSGYVTAGRPHIGVLSATLKIYVSQGWKYEALQKSEEVGEFWMSGFNTVTSAAGETLSFVSERPETFDVIEIEAVRRPGGGTFEIKLDGSVEGTFDLVGDKVEPIVIRLVPDKGPTSQVREVTLTTRTDGTVSIASLAIYNTRAGLTYNSVGYPGATIDILNKVDNRLFVSNLRRLNPQIVVLSFGTNEADKANLDIPAYTERYRKALAKVRAALPAATLVMIGPPDGEELPSTCKDKAAREAATCRPGAETTAAATRANACEWRRLPKLTEVREAQRKIAERDGIVFWNWASIMPKECGAERWLRETPVLMAKDHVHFTIAGYKKSAAAFLDTLIPVIDKVRSRSDAVSNN